MPARPALTLLWTMLLLLHVPVLGGVARTIVDAALDGRVEPDRVGALALLLASQTLFAVLLLRAARSRDRGSRGSWASWLTIVLVLFVAHPSDVVDAGTRVFPPVATATCLFLVRDAFGPALRRAREAWRHFVTCARLAGARAIEHLGLIGSIEDTRTRRSPSRWIGALGARGPPVIAG